ncbi:hypothetical protein [Halothece sp. PCC 7418]|uniref:hypothetical protein n=1 Tax=Halothece sp. (strain PCC 7418) TaxID=65093 RepID=UPI0002E080E7|nr:hypothetical protein [Halothece sp. PCC 7418]
MQTSDSAWLATFSVITLFTTANSRKARSRLLGAWVLTDKSEASVITILNSAQQCNPSYIRSFLRLDRQFSPDGKTGKGSLRLL